MKNNCTVCGIEFESVKPAKTCSPKCRQVLSRQASVTQNGSVTAEIEPSVTFKFTVTYNRKPGDPGYDSDVEAKRKEVRTAKYWYDVPLAAVPVIKKDWPKMPDYMNGRQYFLWWKNEFKLNEDPDKGEEGTPLLHNPFRTLKT